MSSRNRGQKTLSAEDTIDADVVNTIVLEADGQAGNANQYLRKDASNNLVYSDLVIPDNSIDGDKLTGNINISSTGTAQFTGEAGGIGLSITNDIDCASTIRTDSIDNRTGTDIGVSGNLALTTHNLTTTTGHISTTSGDISTSSGALGTTTGNVAVDSGNIFTNSGNISCGGTLETNTIDGFAVGSISVNRNLALTTNHLDTTSGNIQTSSGAIGTTTGNIASDSGNIFTNSGNISCGGTLQTNTIDGFNPGSISVGRNLALTTNSLDTTSGNIQTSSGNIGTTTGQIASDSGAIFTNSGNISTGGTLEADTIDSFSGGEITVNQNLELTTHQLGTTSGAITSATGNIGTTSGNIETTNGNISCGGTLSSDTIASVSGGAISINSNISLPTTAQIDTASGNIQSNSGDISTLTGDLVSSSGNCLVGGSVQTDTIQSRTGGTTQIGIRSDMAFDTNKNLFFVGTGGIGGGASSNIQFNTGSFANIQGNNTTTILFPRTSINLRSQSGTGGNIQADGGIIIFRNLPTSATGLASGQLYNDGGTLKIA